MSNFEKYFREYAAQHPEAPVSEATEHANLSVEFENVLRQLDHKSLVFIHDLCATLVEGGAA